MSDEKGVVMATREAPLTDTDVAYYQRLTDEGVASLMAQRRLLQEVLKTRDMYKPKMAVKP